MSTLTVRARSLRWRLLAATAVALLLALLVAGLLLAKLFGHEVTRQFSSQLATQLDQVTARLDFDAQGLPQIDTGALSDPRWQQPYGGLYWQLDKAASPGSAASTLQRGVLRSRSLWDTTLQLEADTLATGVVHEHTIAGPDDAPLLVLERTVSPGSPIEGNHTGSPWRLLVAADLRPTQAAAHRFNGVLALSLALLWGLLCLAALAQVGVGLAPLKALKQALAQVHAGHAQRLQGPFPSEVQPLIDDFNAVLDRNAEVVARARTQAGNLAHALKTPLAALQQAAATTLQQTGAASPQQPGPASDLASLVQEQVGMARRQVDWHLARTRAAGAQGAASTRVPVQPVVQGLLRVMQRVHAERGLQLLAVPMPAEWAFAGELQDLQEMLGNLLDNACKWARSTVQVSAQLGTKAAASSGAPSLTLVVQDDGPGIAADQRAAAMARGSRLDESVPGTGLGLAIAQDLAGLYGGSVKLLAADGGGLRVELCLPFAQGPAPLSPARPAGPA